MATRRTQRRTEETCEWDDEVPGLARRIRANGTETWLLQWRADGRTVRQTLGRTDQLTLEAARGIARQLRGLDAPAASVPTLARFADDALTDCAGRWKARTLATHRWCARRIVATPLGELRLDRITRQHVANWYAQETGEGARLLAVLSFLMTHAETKGYRPSGSNPCAGLRRRRSTFVARFLAPDEYRRLFKALDERSTSDATETALIRFLAFTGARIGEALTLTWDQLHEHRAVLRDSKTGPRTVWLADEARAVLDRLPRTSDTAFVFAPQLARDSLVNDVRQVWREVIRGASLAPLRPHDLRHSFASVGAALGIDLRVLGGLLGHRDFSSTMGYAHLDRAPVGRAAERVSRRLAKALQAAPPLEPLPAPSPAKPSSRCPERELRRHVHDYRREPVDYRTFCAGRNLDPDAFVVALQRDRKRRHAMIRKGAAR